MDAAEKGAVTHGIDAQGQKVQIFATQLKMFCISPCSENGSSLSQSGHDAISQYSTA